MENVSNRVDACALREPLTSALGAPPSAVNWTVETLPVVNAFPDRRALLRVSGTAEVEGRQRPWGLILKVVGRPARAANDPAHPQFWARERHAFESGLLDTVPGLLPVRCHGISDFGATMHGLWLEELHDEHAGAWSVGRYALAARHLGRLASANADLEAHPWLLHRNLGDAANVAPPAWLLSDATWHNPAVRRAFPAATRQRVAEQWESQGSMRAVIAGLPRTLCHNDAHAGNLFSRAVPGAESETVAIDWELVGQGPLAADITYLIVASLRRGRVAPRDANELEARVLAGFLAGLRDGGRPVDEGLLNLAYHAQIALRLWLIPTLLDLLLSDARHAETERTWRASVADLIERWVPVAELVLDRVATARRLACS